MPILSSRLIEFMVIHRCTSEHIDFRNLVSLLDAELAERDGEEHAFYAQYNGINMLNHCIVIYIHDNPVACGAIKSIGEDAMELKRMYTTTHMRRKGLASRVVAALEDWARELGATQTMLETGKRQPEAIALYQKLGYVIIHNYGQYIGIENSVCFRKVL